MFSDYNFNFCFSKKLVLPITRLLHAFSFPGPWPLSFQELSEAARLPRTKHRQPKLTIHDFANVTLAMSDGFDRVVPSPSWGLLCFALPGNFNVYLERIEVQREKLALSFDLQRQNLFFETNGRERSLCSLGLRQRSTQEKQVSKRRLKYFSLTE